MPINGHNELQCCTPVSKTLPLDQLLLKFHQQSSLHFCPQLKLTLLYTMQPTWITIFDSLMEVRKIKLCQPDNPFESWSNWDWPSHEDSAVNRSFLSAQYMRVLHSPFSPFHKGITASSSLRTVHVLGIPVLALPHLLTVPFASQHGSSHEIWQMPSIQHLPFPYFHSPLSPLPGNTAWQLSIWIPTELQRDGWINTEGRRQKRKKIKACTR